MGRAAWEPRGGESPVDESHSGAVKETGIGLSIVKATVQAYGGKITAKQSGDTITFGAVLWVVRWIDDIAKNSKEILYKMEGWWTVQSVLYYIHN